MVHLKILQKYQRAINSLLSQLFSIEIIFHFRFFWLKSHLDWWCLVVGNQPDKNSRNWPNSWNNDIACVQNCRLNAVGCSPGGGVGWTTCIHGLSLTSHHFKFCGCTFNSFRVGIQCFTNLGSWGTVYHWVGEGATPKIHRLVMVGHWTNLIALATNVGVWRSQRQKKLGHWAHPLEYEVALTPET